MKFVERWRGNMNKLEARHIRYKGKKYIRHSSMDQRARPLTNFIPIPLPGLANAGGEAYQKRQIHDVATTTTTVVICTTDC